jgi:hypothetical protein
MQQALKILQARVSSNCSIEKGYLMLLTTVSGRGTTCVIMVEGEALFINLIAQLSTNTSECINSHVHFIDATVTQQITD